MAKGVKTGPRVKRKGGGQKAKAVKVDGLSEQIAASQAVIVTEYRGLGVKDLQDLRKALKPKGVEYQVIKNSLFARAAEKSGRGAMRPLLVGPTAVALGAIDEVELAKGLVDAMRPYRALKITGGFVGGELMGPDDIQALAKLPPMLQLRGQIVGSIEAPLGQLISVLNAPLSTLVHVMTARAN